MTTKPARKACRSVPLCGADVARLAGGQQHVSENYVHLNPLVYSLDVFTPLIDLVQADYWLPSANRGYQFDLGPLSITTGGLLRLYMWFHIIAGWVLSSLLFVGLTGTIPGL
jgi:hypothetical protein